MSKNSKDIVFVAAQRSAIGRYKGIYKDLQAHNLGSLVIKSLIKKTKLNSDEIDEVILGQVLTGSCGQNPARQAAINSGIPKEKTAIIDALIKKGLKYLKKEIPELKIAIISELFASFEVNQITERNKKMGKSRFAKYHVKSM